MHFYQSKPRLISQSLTGIEMTNNKRDAYLLLFFAYREYYSRFGETRIKPIVWDILL